MTIKAYFMFRIHKSMNLMNIFNGFSYLLFADHSALAFATFAPRLPVLHCPTFHL